MPVQIFCTISFEAEDEEEKGGESLEQFSEEGGQKGVSIAAFAGSSNLHGISHIFVAGGCGLRQVLWGCAFLSSLAIFLYQVMDRVAYYLEHHHITVLDEVDSHLLHFPAVTFCNFNRFRRSQLTGSDLRRVGPLLGYAQGMEIGFQLAPGAPAAGDGAAPLLSMYELFNRTSHRLEDMLKECRYRAQECGPENFTVVFTRYGKCYTFNSGQAKDQPILTTLKGGTGNGLELMLDIQQDEYLPVWGETDETSFEAGIKVQIHGQNEPPFIDQLGFGVPPGFQTFVSCQEQRLIYLPPPWGDCKSTPMDSDFFDTYSMTACRIDCETRYLVENCNCRMVHMPGDAPYCTPEQYRECADPALGRTFLC